ncbi:MAG: mechanosensitive ion channel domain-containing protein [Prosthecochloris sp.]|nr:mechanosensitive ion channel domain-containing protein [Prosthecochloris sp.]
MDAFNTDTIIQMVTTYGIKVIVALAILYIGIKVAGFAEQRLTSTLRKREEIDEMLVRFLGNVTRYGIIAVVIAMVLNQVGIETASIIAVLGTIGLAIGLALQGTLSNIASGVMLMVFRPFTIGNYVEAGGHGGTVTAVNLFTTELTTPDNVQIIIPNNAVWGNSVVNYSYHETRRADFTIGIAYSDNIEQAIVTLKQVIDSDQRILRDPEPLLVVSELAASSVNITIRVWTKSADFWTVKFDMTRRFKEELDRAGITIPFPQQQVHLVRAPGTE